jgi:GTP-binding protein
MEYNTLVNELAQFNEELVLKDKIVAISKAEMLDDELKAEIVKEMGDVKVLFISSITEQGLDILKDELFKAIEENV